MFSLLMTMGDFLLFLSGFFVLIASLIISYISGFVQVRKLPVLFKLLFQKKVEGKGTVDARRALYTAMSTTLGISTIVSPVIAIRLGGPGVVVGFLVATFLGAALNFAEVTAAIEYRFKKENQILGGPMGYITCLFSPFWARWYALFAALLLMMWTAAQANQLAEMLASPLLQGYVVPKWLSGIVLALLVTATLVGGIKRISSFSAKLVPTMFCLFVGSCLWIIGSNFGQLLNQLNLVCLTFWHPQTFGTGAAIGGIMSALRWGVMKCLHGSEAGVGTQTIPHSMAEANSPQQQGILAMASTYSAGLVLLLSSMVALVTHSWCHSHLPMGISMVAYSFQLYFSHIGLAIVVLSVVLFAFGTIVGNSFNGSQCYLFLFPRKTLYLFYYSVAGVVFLGSISNVHLVWSVIDYGLVFILLPNVSALLWLAFSRPYLLNPTQKVLENENLAVSGIKSGMIK